MSDTPYPKPFDEQYRLRVLEDLAILDTEPELEFDRLAWLAAKQFDVQIAVLSLVDADRQWFKACCGLDATETPRNIAFCAHAIMTNEAFVILDATKDLRFKDNPLVVGPPHIRFYAGIPLEVNGAAIGTFCIIDDKPRASFGPEEREVLGAFAEIVKDELKLRGHMRKTTEDLVDEICQSQRSAEAGETAKAQFFALVSHELRTPLNAVIAFGESISVELMGRISQPEYKEFAEHIVAAGKRELRLIERLIELADKGRVDIREENLDFPELVRHCVDLLSGETILAATGVDLDLPEDTLLLKADRDHVEQIVLELISNAIKFTPKGGRIGIQVAVDADNESLVLMVRDTGVGINEAALDQALTVFGQLSNGLDREYEGAGLGLPIVHKLAELHGAELTLVARPTGGTRAEVRFPPYRTVAKLATADRSADTVAANVAAPPADQPATEDSVQSDEDLALR